MPACSHSLIHKSAKDTSTAPNVAKDAMTAILDIGHSCSLDRLLTAARVTGLLGHSWLVSVATLVLNLWGGPSGPCPRNNHARRYNPDILGGSGEILAMLKDKQPRAFTLSGHGPDGPPHRKPRRGLPQTSKTKLGVYKMCISCGYKSTPTKKQYRP